MVCGIEVAKNVWFACENSVAGDGWRPQEEEPGDESGRIALEQNLLVTLPGIGDGSPVSFPETRWTELAAATLGGSEEGRQALAAMCAAYRPCLINHLRARGTPPEEAEDIVQETFQAMLETRAWSRADPAKGRFRSFLLGLLNHVMSRRQERLLCAKRGGGRTDLAWEDLLESGAEPAAVEVSPDPWFDREWAMQVVNLALEQVESSWRKRNPDGNFGFMRRYLPGGAGASYAETAKELGLSISALKSEIYRLRMDFRSALRSGVARTVSAPHEIEEELRYLREVLARDAAEGNAGSPFP